MSYIVPEIARQVGLSPAFMLRLFPSHAWAYGYRRHELHDILHPWERGIDFEDYSVSSAHPAHTKSDRDLARFLGDRIRQSDVLLIMAEMYANHSDWMEFEIHAAAASGIPIIPVVNHGQKRIPAIAKRFAACEPVRWRSQSIRSAILACLSPSRRRAFEDGMRRAQLQRIEQQRLALFKANTLARPTLLSGNGAFGSPAYSWPLPNGKAPKYQSLVEALIAPELPPVLKK